MREQAWGVGMGKGGGGNGGIELLDSAVQGVPSKKSSDAINLQSAH